MIKIVSVKNLLPDKLLAAVSFIFRVLLEEKTYRPMKLLVDIRSVFAHSQMNDKCCSRRSRDARLVRERLGAHL